MKRVIITGANSFVGSAVVRELCRRGHSVTAIVRSVESDCSRIADLCPIVACDQSDYVHLPERINQQQHDIFMHFAWAGTAGPLRGDYALQLANSRYVCDAIKAAHKLGCDTFLFASSIMQYELLHSIESTDRPALASCYSIAKVAATYLAKTIAAEQGIGFISAVISNIYGPGEDSPRLVNALINKLLLNEHAPVTQGTQMYDFIYIDDAARAFCSIVEAGSNNRSYYIGTESPQPLSAFLTILQEQVNPSQPLGFGEIAFNGISLDYASLFDLNALHRDTGFVCQVSFAEGIRRTAQYIKERITTNDSV